jgi:hypothetical protein
LCYYYSAILMKFSVDTKEAPPDVYLSVVCRHNLVINGCKSQAVVYRHTQTALESQKPPEKPRSMQWIAHKRWLPRMSHVTRLSGKGSAMKHRLKECRLVQRNSIDLSFWLIDLSLYLAATLTCIKKACFRELNLKVSKVKLNFKDQI